MATPPRRPLGTLSAESAVHCFVLLMALALSACTPRGSGPGMGPPAGTMVDLEEKRFVSAPGVGGLEGFSQAVKIGKRVYLSGQLGLDPAGEVVGPGDLAAQAAQAFRNLGAVLHAAGATPEDVVQLDIFVVGLKDGDLGRIREAGAQFFPPGKAPTGSVVGIQSLPVSGLLVALNATAETKGLFPDREALRRYQ